MVLQSYIPQSLYCGNFDRKFHWSTSGNAPLYCARVKDQSVIITRWSKWLVESTLFSYFFWFLFLLQFLPTRWTKRKVVGDMLVGKFIRKRLRFRSMQFTGARHKVREFYVLDPQNTWILNFLGIREFFQPLSFAYENFFAENLLSSFKMLF